MTVLMADGRFPVQTGLHMVFLLRVDSTCALIFAAVCLAVAMGAVTMNWPQILTIIILLAFGLGVTGNQATVVRSTRNDKYTASGGSL